MEAFVLMSEIFSNMSEEFYSQYVEIAERLKKLGQGRNSWDMLSHTKEENDVFKSIYAAQPRCAIAATVFQALAVEAYVNFYGLQKLGETVFNGKLERKPIIEKITTILEIVSKKEYPRESEVCKDIEILFKKRHKLMHCKAKAISTEETSIENYKTTITKFAQSMHDQLWFVNDGIENIMTVYTRLKAQLAELDETNIDLAQLQTQKQTDYSKELIFNILNKGLFGGCLTNETSI